MAEVVKNLGCWLTAEDGTRVSISEAEFDVIWRAAKAAEADRAARMPDEQSAIRAMADAFQRLKQLGWREAIYCPKDGTSFDTVEPGSTGIHEAYYYGEWPTGGWMTTNDPGPLSPCLFRPTPTPAAMGGGADE